MLWTLEERMSVVGAIGNELAARSFTQEQVSKLSTITGWVMVKPADFLNIWWESDISDFMDDIESNFPEG